MLVPATDLSTPELRAGERRRLATLAALMSLFAKVVSVGAMLLTIPITLEYLGAERFGMWMILSSFIAMLSFADLGIGNGILNAVSAADGRDDLSAMQRGISSGVAVLTLVASILVTGFAFTYPQVPWHELFNVTSSLARQEAGPAIAVFAVCFAAAIPITVVQRVQMGLQRGFLASAWLAGGSVLTVIGLLTAIWLEAGLPVLVAVFVGAPLVANICNNIAFFGWQRRDLLPRWSSVSRKGAGAIMQTGLLFFVLQIAAAATYNAHPIVIAQVLGADAVPQYSVPERAFSLITMTVMMAMAPLWPAYREAITRGDVDWTRQTLKKAFFAMVAYAAVLAVPGAILTVYLRFVGRAGL